MPAVPLVITRSTDQDRTRGEAAFHRPSFLPEGEGLLFRLRRTNNQADTIVAVRGETRREVYRVQGGDVADPIYSDTGHLIFGQEDPGRGIWAAPFSLSSLSLGRCGCRSLTSRQLLRSA